MKMVTLTMAAVTLLAVFSFRHTPKDASNSGLYLTPDDFKHNKLSFSGNASGETTTRIKIHEGLFGSSTVDLIYNGKKQVFSTGQVYGYRDRSGQDYRFFASGAYRILDTAGFYLYSCVKMVQGEKIARPKTLHFFSVKPTDDIRQLTLANIESSFPGNARFRYGVAALCGPFRSDVELAAYDGMLKCYKIKYLYAQSQP
jgi:hypothetical protein